MIALLTAPAATLASEGSEEREGARILRQVESGERDCGGLETPDYELVGEYAMGRMLGSPAAHESMDRMMASMMGEGGLDQMHLIMGRRFTGCGVGRVPPGFGGMMGMLGMMGRGPGYGPGAGPGQVGASRDRRAGPGGMMGPGASGAEDDDDRWGAVGWVMTAILLALLAVVAIALIAAKPWRARPAPGRTAEEILQQRLARGEIEPDEYRRLQAALRGGVES